ncbi:DNA damage-inducible protein [Halorhabdus tiamatea SARL4B]|uniref:Multidrug-efflux transporter n=1 Tax=Halorhabdus tiamatea SARL4B TaxID=1033806 RepID=F7PH83_9EURY|nr:MATE family efflux transporter [Halorhabdus tiamatea]ERJ05582.1 DNA damage-inducible protein [Halorhabdus tiamatea SARL4B]CCQ32501.1 DNA damage-inducible protein / sodium-driven multidrug efflux pump protein [Halorhabdus tiamatea SARL4B]
MVDRDRLFELWGRAASLSWPVAVQHAFTTLMRTVDIVVAGLFAPAYVTAIGLADLYGQIPLRVGLSLGTGAIAMSSQDTGRGAKLTRNRGITQAVLIGFLIGLPMVAVGLVLSDAAIAILGAEREVVRLGGTYLALIFAAAPMRIVGLVGSRSLQGTGDTVTPMVVNGGASVLNALATVTLALGVGPAPRLGIVGIGLATLLARIAEAGVIVAAIASRWTELAFARPRSLSITGQLLRISAPNFAEGMSTSLANFPFNSLLLVFGTEVNAAFHIGRRIYQQVAGPVYRAINTVTSILVGQALGEGDAAEARYIGFAMAALSIVTMGVMGAALVAGAAPIAGVFTDDAATLGYAIPFTQVFGVSMVFFGVFFPFAGGLRGAGETRIPFYARAIGSFVFMLGLSALLSVGLGWGVTGIYVGLVANYACWAVVAVAGFLWSDWAEKAAGLMEERADVAE